RRAGPPDELVIVDAGGESLERRGFGDQSAARRRRLRKKRAPFEARGRRHAGRVEKRRGHVEMGRVAAPDAARAGRPRNAGLEGNEDLLFEEIRARVAPLEALAVDPAIAEGFAVVGGKEDRGPGKALL